MGFAVMVSALMVRFGLWLGGCVRRVQR
jgi:hypothetical protein